MDDAPSGGPAMGQRAAQGYGGQRVGKDSAGRGGNGPHGPHERLVAPSAIRAMEGPAAISDRDRWDLEIEWHRATCSRNAAKTLHQRPHDLPGVWGRSRVGGPSRHCHPVAHGILCEFRGAHGGDPTRFGTRNYSGVFCGSGRTHSTPRDEPSDLERSPTVGHRGWGTDIR